MIASRPGSLWVIWIAIVIAVVIQGILFLVLQVGRQPTTPPVAVEAILVVFAVANALLAAQAPNLLRAIPPVSRQIIQWALLESVAIVGGINALIGGNLMLSSALVAVSFVALLIFRPGLIADAD